eukprot:GHVU01128673.1.p1 GENE.GHVU01128673.1~~GHVU01128673.1.p1  ORF type:complete len:243 (+),score=6.39 GHVU01128673.1:63-731(+)
MASTEPSMQSMLLMTRKQMVSKEYIVSGLRSNRGAALNGSKCVVVGFDAVPPYRLGCRMNDTGETVSLSAQSLQEPQSKRQVEKWIAKYPRTHSHVKPLEALLRERVCTGELFGEAILSAIEKGRKELTERPASCWRLQKLLEFYQSANGSLPHDYVQPHCGYGGDTPLLRPACMGNGIVDFSQFADHMSPSTSVLHKRLFEYLVSGFCERCQLSQFEVHDY